MQGAAHLTIGMASAMAVIKPDSLPAALPVIAGAAAGCLICDIDCDSPSEKKNTSRWRISAILIAAAALILYGSMSGGILAATRELPAYIRCAGVCGFVITCAFASVSSHRGFSHSLLALLLEAISLYAVFPPAALPFAIAFASHLLLDLTNRKPVRLFYPAKRGYALHWFYADRLANRLCAYAGTVWLAAEVLILFRK